MLTLWSLCQHGFPTLRPRPLNPLWCQPFIKSTQSHHLVMHDLKLSVAEYLWRYARRKIVCTLCILLVKAACGCFSSMDVTGQAKWWKYAGKIVMHSIVQGGRMHDQKAECSDVVLCNNECICWNYRAKGDSPTYYLLLTLQVPLL